jgi:hypothetical protein
MAFSRVAVGSAVGGGLLSFGANAAEGRRQKIKAEQAKQNAKKAKDQLDRQKEMFMHLDTSNPYLNMENVAEDLVVNQQQAQFQAQQNAQSQANVMNELSGAAGGSGIAALAQSMAGQAATANQAASASIGQQEVANQRVQVQQEAKIQEAEREGEMKSREMVADKLSTSMQFTSDELMNAKREQAIAEHRRNARRKASGDSLMNAGIGAIGQIGSGGDFGDFLGGVGGF